MGGAMNILVTGCAGFIGSHLCDSLLSSGHSVLGIDAFTDNYAKDQKVRNLRDLIKQPNFSFYATNFSEIEYYSKFDFDIIVHLAAHPGVRPSLLYPDKYIDNNIAKFVKLLEFARKLKGIKKFIFASSSSVYGNNNVPFAEDATPNPISIYGATKLAGESLCRTYYNVYNLPVTCLRFFTCYGPRQRPDLAIRLFSEKIFKGEPITILGNGATSRDYTYIGDIVAGINKAIVDESSGFNIYNLGNNRPMGLHELINILFSVIGKKTELVYKEMQLGDVNHTWADISRAAKVLNWKPQVEFSTGLSLFIAWLKDQQCEFPI